MKWIDGTFAAVIVTTSLVLHDSRVAAEEVLQLTTEQYAPFNFEQDGEIAGLGADQVREVMHRSGIAYEMTLMPWSRAIGLAGSQPMTCVFTTAHTVDRNKRFKWVEPLLVERTLIIRAEDSAVDPADLKAATAYRTGTQTGDYTVELLRNAGFSQIDLARDLDLTLTKLLNGRVDLMAVSESYLHRLRDQGVPVEEVAVLFEQVFSVACSLDTPDDIVERMQSALSEMIADGTQAEIHARYN
ncbi:transporter substrate-binding domain-containing protein [Pelagibius litoralis]|uniref:Transporter substrate-binding domain-containing protein n=1 Tax=Pelagibius litoralis TaxID=374515 RepID=A0A967CAD2_9PROT|nr:transporter substrate-binding domain-containing protein [Pelagibius litoralis]NIA67319.1 transporter substrate-binding domain-containing protein [Pelagibius litoralis]